LKGGRTMTDSPLSGKRILVVEDNIENMRLFHAILKLEGVEVLEADEGPKGLELARREQPNLILMDIHMPGMDGLTATRLLREDEQTRDIPIVAVTASVMEKDRNKTIEAGCDGVIAKPIDPDIFASQLAAFLNEQ